MNLRSLFFRRLLNAVMNILAGLAAALALFSLAWIITEVVRRGVQAFTLEFFARLPTPPGIAGGGVANALLGSFIITAGAVILGVPAGLFAGIYLAETGPHTRLAAGVRFVTNVLMGIPSIIVGLFVYSIMVMPMGHFSGAAGAVALAVIMFPLVARVTEDMLYLVPNSLRESALALGAARWRVTLGIVFRSARAGLITAGMLAVARVAGETAPLLFTALNSPYWPGSPLQPMANLTVTIFNYALSPYADWQRTAWGAAFLIMMAVLGLNLLTRGLFREARK